MILQKKTKKGKWTELQKLNIRLLSFQTNNVLTPEHIDIIEFQHTFSLLY